MDTYKFKCWCEKAASGIVFPPDQQKVYRELMNHMDDHYDFLLEQGYDPDIAQQRVVDAMGDPWPIAKDLAAIHRPFWGYFLRATRIILIIALIVTVIPLGIYAWNNSYGISSWAHWDIWDPASYGGDTGRTLLHMSEPNVTRRDSGYTFTVTDALWWDSDDSDYSCLMIYMKEFHPLPWAMHNEVGGWFWAEDSEGNIFEAFNVHGNLDEDPGVQAWGNPTGPFTWTYQIWINFSMPYDAEWIDFRYTRDGRNLVWRIDLTGGVNP